LMDIITNIRNVRGEMNIAPGMFLNVNIQSPSPEARQDLENHKNYLQNLAKIKNITIYKPSMRPANAATAVVGDHTIYVSLEDIIDFDQEEKRLKKEIEKIDKELIGINKKLSNEDFLSKAPDNVVAKVKEKNVSLTEKRVKLNDNLSRVIKLNS